MIIEIALGVALGLFIFANRRGLLALSTLVGLFLLLLVLTGIACWALYSGVQSVRALPPLVQQGSSVSTVLNVGFGLLLNLLLAFAVGNVIEQRLRLESREAYTLGGVFYILFLVSAIATPVAINSYLETKALAAPLLLLVLLVAWALGVQQCMRRARKARQRIAA
jgi:hypothetical protein